MSMVSMVMKVMSMVTKVTATATALPSMVSEFGGLDACQHGVFSGTEVFKTLAGQAMVIVMIAARFGTVGKENDPDFVASGQPLYRIAWLRFS